jgi:hypothetical protein
MLVECTECHARNFVAAVLNDGDPQEAQLALRRLTQDALGSTVEDEGSFIEPYVESEAPSVGERVTAGDVVDMHEFLESFDGDFRELFR